MAYPDDLDDLSPTAQERVSVWHSTFGDFRFLDEHLQKGKATPWEQKVVADIIMGRRKIPANRPRKLQVWQRDQLIYDFVNRHAKSLCGGKKEAALAQAMEDFGMKRPGIRDALKRAKRSKVRIQFRTYAPEKFRALTKK